MSLPGNRSRTLGCWKYCVSGSAATCHGKHQGKRGSRDPEDWDTPAGGCLGIGNYRQLARHQDKGITSGPREISESTTGFVDFSLWISGDGCR